MADPIDDFELSSNVSPPEGEQTAPSAGPDDAAVSVPVTEEDTPPDIAAAESDRDEQGKFTRRNRRHRAKDQATPADVPRIQELSKQNAELKKQIEASKAPDAQPVQQAPQPQAPPVQTAPAMPPPARPQTPQTFPAFDVWLAAQGNTEKTYDDYQDARADWRWQINDALNRAVEANRKALDTRQQKVDAYEAGKVKARTQYADFDALLEKAPNVSGVMVEALLASERSAEIAYHLASHPELATELARDTFQHDPSAFKPMQRLLESYLAPHAAAVVGSALALVKPPPKPPNPTRTQVPMKSGDEPPGDDASFEEHEKAFPDSRRRRR